MFLGKLLKSNIIASDVFKLIPKIIASDVLGNLLNSWIIVCDVLGNMLDRRVIAGDVLDIRDRPVYNIVKISKNTLKSTGGTRRLPVFHQLKQV